MYPCPTIEQKDAERERLILEHLPQVRLIARRIHERLPANVSLDDLVSTGIVGLISAVDNYDPNQNVKLRTYAEYKIRGAILDSLRGLDWAPRDKRKKAKQIEAAISAAEQRLRRTVTEEEIAAELGVEIDEYHAWLTDIQGLSPGSREYASAGTEGRDWTEVVADEGAASPSRQLEVAELERLLAQAIDEIPLVERNVLSLYYREELTLREIAQVMNVHLSRASQLKSQAVVRLRAYMEQHWPIGHGR